MFIAFIYIVGWLKYYESLGELEMAQDRKKVLVLGAGYAGLQTVTKLQKELSADAAEITLINRMNIIMNQLGCMKLLPVRLIMKIYCILLRKLSTKIK